MKKWYLYDKDSNAYKFSYILSDTQPDNSTEVDPGDKVNPKWSGSEWVDGPVSEPTPIEPTETDKLKAMVGNLVAENAKKDQVVESLQKMIGQSITDSAQKNKDIQDMKVLIANLAADKVTPK